MVHKIVLPIIITIFTNTICLGMQNSYDAKSKDLIDAVLKNDAHTVNQLLNQGIQPDHIFYTQKTLILLACDVIRGLHREKQIKDTENADVMIEADTFNKIDSFAIFENLLEHNADPEYPYSDGKTPFHIACKLGNLELARLLLRYKVNPLRQDYTKSTPLHAACQSEAGNIELVKLLLQRQANPLQKDNTGSTPIHYAALNGFSDILKSLLAAISRDNVCFDIINFIDANGCTPLHDAAKNGKLKCIKILLDFFETRNPDFLNNKNNTPLHYAAIGGHSDVVRFLAQKGANVNAKNYAGDTPLHCAAQQGHTRVVDLLILWDANPKLTNRMGKTSSMIANEAGFGDLSHTIDGHVEKYNETHPGCTLF